MAITDPFGAADPRPPGISAEDGAVGAVRALVDAVVGLLIVAVLWAPAIDRASPAGTSVLPWVPAVAAVVGVTLRWRLPALSGTVVFLATAAATVLGSTDDPFLLAAWALYPFAVGNAARAGRLPLVALAGCGGVAAVVGVPDATGGSLGRTMLTSVVLLSGSWMLGTAVGRQLASAVEAEQARAEQRLSEVRLQVAREVHDVVAHTLGTIGAEAGVVRGLPDASPQELRDSLTDIEGFARTALTQVQSLLRTLRSTDAPRGPAPGLADLPALLAQAEAAGVSVAYRRSGAADVDPVRGLTVYRIIGEAVSNVVRHAPGARCEVTVDVGPAATRVRIRDDGPGRPATAVDGYGLTGLRERSQLAGGTASVGNLPGGGFQVTVVLPAGRRAEVGGGVRAADPRTAGG